MNRIRILALIAAVLTAVSVYFYLQSKNKPAPVVTVSVIAANQMIPQRAEITADMIKTVQLPPEAVHPDAVRSASDVIGTTANVQIEADEQILNTKLIKKDDVKGGLSYQIEPDMRAITIPVDEVTGIAGYLAAEDSVDVLTILDYNITNPETKEVITRSFSFVLLQDVKVLAAGNSEQNKPGTKVPSYGTVTLLVTPQDAVKLNLAIMKGNIRLILRGGSDHKKPQSDPAIAESLIEAMVPKEALIGAQGSGQTIAAPTPTPTPADTATPTVSPAA